MATSGTSRTIGWNGLQLSTPAGWETIVSAPTHLLFEQDLDPILEIKWQQSSRSNRAAKLDKGIFETLKKEFGAPENIHRKSSWAKLLPQYQVTHYSWTGTNSVEILFLVCPSCNTTLLCRFLQYSTKSRQQITEVLQSLCCHNEDTRNRWSILDFSFMVPKTMKLKTFSIAAGFTRLSFEEKGQYIHLCRLAPASQRLKKATLEDTLIQLVGDDRKNVSLTQHEHFIELYTLPSIFSQIKRRLKREKPFKYGRLWHAVDHDRIFGLSVESIKPISKTTVDQLFNNHEIIS